MGRQLHAISENDMAEGAVVFQEDHPLLGLRTHADRRCGAIDYPEPLLRLRLTEAEGTFCDRCIKPGTGRPEGVWIVTDSFVMTIIDRHGRFTDTIIEKYKLHDFATRYANNYSGDYPFMKAMRARASRRLSTGQARGVMNCWKVAHCDSYAQTG